MTKVRRMFPGGNTAEGFYSFHNNIIGDNRNMLYILKGMPGGGKSSLMKEVGERVLEEGYTVEYHHCPSDPNSVDGIVIDEFKIAIVDGTFPHIIDPVYPGLKDKLINLGIFIDSDKLKENEEQIIEAKLNNKIAYRKSFSYFKAAKCIYKEIEETNKTGVDFKKVNKLTKTLIDEIFSKEANMDFTFLKERHMFSNANTPDGFIDYTSTILEGISNIYYIEGEIGIGKSTLINRIMEEAIVRGYSIEIYHNATIPDKIESVFIKEIDVFITSNSQCKEISHNKIDLNQYFDESVKDEKDYKIYDLLSGKAISKLLTAKKNHEILEKCYSLAIDFEGINEVKDEILEEILTVYI